MAIKEEEQKKNGMKIVDNMDGAKNATQKLNMKVADVSDKMTVSEINERDWWKKTRIINASNGSYITICSELCRRLNT